MMRSATAFLPPSMITFMNLDSSTLPNFGSGRISRLGTSRRRGIFHLYFCFSWRHFRHRESHTQLSLTRPAHTMCVEGHYAASSRHATTSTRNTPDYLAFGRLAPYLERACLRSLTPCRSSEPRTMW